MARDQNGHLLWAGGKKITAVRSAIEVEAEAIRWASQTLVGFGYSRFIIETDSLMLYKMIIGEEETWPKLLPIIQEIKALLTGNLEAGVGYYPRSGNKTVDRIAREATTFTSFVPKLYSIVPLWLKSCLEFDKLSVRN
ncbi:uncharacterized protein LOC108829562 [Raphanus sativus]|uniref:Uncharacterized protein LOC108829562 n=1 Tax=Raphanus sativus TaxID=3726 RepID=A0A6J0LES1_RAPSA|nr:uncharacterized protein LOC108829562 [Raphanus sativus]